MKRFIIVISTFFIVSLLACQDTKEEDLRVPDIAFYKRIGKQIPFETGMRWMEFYKSKNSNEGRLGLSFAKYAIADIQVEAMLESVSNLVGVAFHYATDGFGKGHIIAIPIDESLSLWSSIPGRIYVDANTGNPITQSVAQTWAQNYKNAHPTELWFHFFGQNIFEEILLVPFFNSMAVEPALDDLNLSPELLLVIWNEGTFLGRTKDENGVVFDASSPCPPCAME